MKTAPLPAEVLCPHSGIYPSKWVRTCCWQIYLEINLDTYSNIPLNFNRVVNSLPVLQYTAKHHLRAGDSSYNTHLKVPTSQLKKAVYWALSRTCCLAGVFGSAQTNQRITSMYRETIATIFAVLWCHQSTDLRSDAWSRTHLPN